MKITARIVAAVFAFYVLLLVLGSILTMELPRVPLDTSPSSVGLNYEDVSFLSRGDSLQLSGWYLPGQSNAVIIIVHGGFQNRVDDEVDTLGLSRDLVQRGYNLLLFDLRGRGESAGSGRSLMNIQQDIGGAVDYLKSRGYPVANIGILGFCSGAVAACIFASEENVGALALDGCFPTVRGMAINQATDKGIPKPIAEAFMPGLFFTAKVLYGYKPVNAIDVISSVQCPILFIHEGNDTLISSAETTQLFKASKNLVNEVWEIPSVTHSHAYRTFPSQYVDHLDNFFANKLKSNHVVM